MYQNHLIVSELAQLHRRDLASDAERHRRPRRDPSTSHRILRRR